MGNQAGKIGLRTTTATNKMKSDPLKVAFVGWGAINSRVADLLKQHSANVQFVGVAISNASKRYCGIPIGARQIDKPGDLAELAPDLVLEAASKAAVEEWIPIALSVSKTVIIASTSAFTDGKLLAQLRDKADCHGSRLIIPTGAIGGIDALTSAAMLPLDQVVHRISKPPNAWRNTDAEKLFNLSSLTEQTIFFRDTARKAAKAFPQNANATVVTALAGMGLDNTIVELVVDPLITRNQHTISARGVFGRFTITLENEPLQGNPKSSELTALNLARLIAEQTVVTGVIR
jgi:aspartate dehydrogenase